MSLHLLVPVDASAWSAAASKVALQLAASQPGRVTGVHVVNVRSASGNILKDLPGHLGFEPAVVSDEAVACHTEQAQKLLMAFAEEARDKGIAAETVVRSGSVAHTIKELGESADLVVLGLRGETEQKYAGQGGALSGWLPTHLETPILFTVPDSAPIRAVAIGFDGSPGALHGVRAIRNLLAPLGVPVHGIYVSADGTGGEVLDDLEQHLDGVEVFRHVVHGDSPHEALLRAAKRLDVQLLVLGFGGHSPLRDFVFGSGTERVLLSARVGVLITR